MLKVSHSTKKFNIFYGNLKFLTAFTKARHHSFSWARPIQSIIPFRTLSSKCILILSSHLPLCFASGLLPSGFPIHMRYESLSHTCYKYRPSHSSWPNHPTDIWWGSFLKLRQVWTLQIVLSCVAKFSFSVCRLNQRFACKMKLTKSEESGLLSRSTKHTNTQTQNTNTKHKHKTRFHHDTPLPFCISSS